MSNAKTITMPREVAQRILANIESGNRLSASIELRREIEHPKPGDAPYLWYDPGNGSTWTPEAIADGYDTEGLIPLYENQSTTKGKK